MMIDIDRDLHGHLVVRMVTDQVCMRHSWRVQRPHEQSANKNQSGEPVLHAAAITSRRFAGQIIRHRDASSNK